MTIAEINQLSIEERIKAYKSRKTTLPDRDKLLADWDVDKHDVMDTEKRKKRKITTQQEERDPVTSEITKPAQTEEEDVNRIAIPLEQDIVNIQTAFTVGNLPKMTLESEDEKEKKLFGIIERVLRQNKIKYINKRVMRSWLAEQEVAEYWYTVEDANWWQKILQKITGVAPKNKLKVALWSPFRGDSLYPLFDEYGDMIAFSREYKGTDAEGEDVTKFMVIDDTNVTTYVDDEIESTFKHGFDKIPVMYIYRDKPYCHKIRTIRNRIEVLMSNFADCLDYNFFPKLTAKGVVENVINRGTGSEIIQLENGAEIAYLTWQQSPEMAKMELESLTEKAYAMTNTPRVSVDYIKGAGNAVSGKAFKYVFMGAHMQVSNHAEDLEEYLQRRVNFLTSAIGTIYTDMKSASETIDIEVEIVPFTIDNKSEAIKDAVDAYKGGVASRRQGIILAGITDATDDELREIEGSDKEETKEPKTE